MKMKKRQLLILMLMALMTGACIYDFNAEVPGTEGIVVIEGDILIGDYTRVRVTTSMPLTGNDPARTLASTVTVEASDGTRYTGRNGSSIDTRFADPGLEYRLVVSNDRGTYASAWAPVLQAAAIDSLAYTISDDHTTMTVDVSAHGGPENLYYRWIAEETWEYHAPFQASHFFVPRNTYLKGKLVERDTVAMYEDGENTYYCWNHGQVSDLMIASAKDLTENRIVRHPLYAMDRYEQRISYIYSVLLIQEALTETAYRYWDMMQKNSSDVGGLFSPEPYEMRGNILNVDDPDEMVLGYVSVTAPSTLRYYIHSYEIMFARSKPGEYDIEPTYVQKNDWYRYYRQGYSVYMLHTDEGAGTGRETEADYEFDWLPNRCVHCEMLGGSKVKPDYWPNNHK